jgi:cyclopropane fatty-acyl-phospholipid synthase-like methyltransferase
VLELAPGTGNWSVHLAPRAARLTLVDGSAEMLAHNPAAGQPHVRTEIADLFHGDTAERFDRVVFAFWISHVPRERLASFFARVGSWLRPGRITVSVHETGRLFQYGAGRVAG